MSNQTSESNNQSSTQEDISVYDEDASFRLGRGNYVVNSSIIPSERNLLDDEDSTIELGRSNYVSNNNCEDPTIELQRSNYVNEDSFIGLPINNYVGENSSVVIPRSNRDDDGAVRSGNFYFI